MVGFISFRFFRYPKGFCLLEKSGNLFLTNSWCVLGTSPLSDVCLAKVIPRSVACLQFLTFFSPFTYFKHLDFLVSHYLVVFVKVYSKPVHIGFLPLCCLVPSFDLL